MFHRACIRCSIFPMNLTPTRRFGFKSTSNCSAILSALLNKQSNCSSLRFVFSNWIKVLTSSKAEVRYVFHRNDIGRLQTATLDILLLPHTGLWQKCVLYVHGQFSFKSMINKKNNKKINQTKITDYIYVIKRIHSVDIVSIGIDIYIIYF